MAAMVSQAHTVEGATSPWSGFQTGLWQKEINVRDFIQQNYAPYEGDASFLTSATARTERVWDILKRLFIEERRKGVLDVSQIPSSITAHPPGYIDKDNEIIVGLQTDAPLKRAIMPNGGLRLVVNALKAYGYDPDPQVLDTFSKYRKTHNDAVFDAYTADVRRCRSSHILTGLPDAYGRGRIIGDYRRVALYGVKEIDRTQAGGEEQPRFAPLYRRHHPRARRDGAARLRATSNDGIRHGRYVRGGRQPVGDQVRQGVRDARWDRPGDRLPDRRVLPDVRQQRQPGGSPRLVGGVDVHEQVAEVSDLSQRPPHTVDPDHHLERRLRQGDWQHARRPPPGCPVCTGSQPDARPRHPRHSCLGRVGGEDPLSRRHRSLTGMDNAPTFAFARRLASVRKPIWLRFVLVPGLSDDPEDIAKIAAFAAELGVVERVDVLPFHQMGQFKWKKLGLEYTLDDVRPPTDEIVERTCGIFRQAGLKTIDGSPRLQRLHRPPVIGTAAPEHVVRVQA
jgi:hypothetical protein